MSYSPPPPPPPGAEGGYGYAAPKTNQKAIWSLVLGILGLICCGIFAGIPAIFLGNSAKKEIAASGGAQGGAGMAQAGFIIGIIATVLGVLGVILLATGVVTTDFSSN
jgi:putative exporter of polyketide antibiotics